MFETRASDLLPSLHSLTPLLLSLLGDAQTFFAKTELSSLLFLAVVVHAIGRCVAGRPEWARRIGLLSCLAFCLHGYGTTRLAGSVVDHYASLGFRAVLALLIVQGAAAMTLTSLGWAWTVAMWPCRSLDWKLFLLRLRLARLWARLVRALRRRTITPLPVPPPAPLPTLRDIVEQAKRDYEATCSSLRSAGLDEDELGSALLFARQKYLRRIHGVMKGDVS
jgi:hypothetical protein